MTAADAAGSFPSADEQSVLSHCLDEVFAAGWMEATRPPQQGAEQNLVTANQSDQYRRRQLEESLKHMLERSDSQCRLVLLRNECDTDSSVRRIGKVIGHAIRHLVLYGKVLIGDHLLHDERTVEVRYVVHVIAVDHGCHIE